MFFDDRLATVLRHRASGESAARTQFRQLLDLLGSRKYGRDHTLVAAAWLRLGALGEQIPAAQRAAMIREPGWKFRSPELAAHLAEDESDVAAAALARADLSEDDWEALIPRLPIRARGFLRLRRQLPPRAEALLDRLGISDRGLPHPETTASQDDDPPVTPPQSVEAPLPPRQHVAMPANDSGPEASAIGALVERIESFRKERTRTAPPIASPGAAPRLPLEETGAGRELRPALGFAFACDTTGRISWADPAVAPMIVGTRLFERTMTATRGPGEAIARAFQHRQPVRGARLTLAGAPAVAGDWIVEARPRFTDPGGHFFGYAGRFRRAPVEPARPSASAEHDQMRQLLHELRTPVNAVQGFAEVIQQQLFGPAPHEYRALAATIAGDAARILAGFEELDRLARLEGGSLRMEAGSTDFRALVTRTLDQLEQVLAPRAAAMVLATRANEALHVPLEAAAAEGLAWRLLATLAGVTGAGESLALALAARGRTLTLACDLPAQLAGEDDIFAADVRPAAGGISTGVFGAGFTLRLARAEAMAAGGSLEKDGGRIVLVLPLLTEAGPVPSHAQGAREA